jgi:DnaJ-class molecular chaperone
MAGDPSDIFDMLRRQFGFGGGGPGGDPFSQFRQAQQNRQPRNRDVKISMQINLEDNLIEQTKVLNIGLPGDTKENIEIKIPRGVLHGTTIRYPNLGDHSVPNTPRGDLYVQFHIRPQDKFEQHGIDLVVPIVINCLEAATGCDKEITGLDGKTFKITVPQGTQYGAKFGIPEQGLYTTQHPGPGRGRLIASLEIYVPKELTAEQITILKSMQAEL